LEKEAKGRALSKKILKEKGRGRKTQKKDY